MRTLALILLAFADAQEDANDGASPPIPPSMHPCSTRCVETFESVWCQGAGIGTMHCPFPEAEFHLRRAISAKRAQGDGDLKTKCQAAYVYTCMPACVRIGSF